MPPRVYLETTILSYLTSLPSRDVIVVAHQAITHDWWDIRRTAFDLFTSQIVVDECEAGHPEAARRRLEALSGIQLLDPTDDALTLAQELLSAGCIPTKASADAAHIALATVHGMDYLLTWNCAHIANAEMRPRIARLASSRGYTLPGLCTPEELMGGDN